MSKPLPPAVPPSLLTAARRRLELSRAKHPSLVGHPRIALRLSRILPEYQLDRESALGADAAPKTVLGQREEGLARLSGRLHALAPKGLAASRELATSLSDLQLIGRNRVPFPFRELAGTCLPVASIMTESSGSRLRDLDGNWLYDLGGSYGVNLFGEAVYKRCVERGVERVSKLGLVLGTYHPIVADNVARLRALSGMDEVTFHMSGTEAVMQAVRVARYRSRRSHVVRFAGAYHGFSEGVQAGPGNPLPAENVYTLAEGSDAALHVLATRHDIAAVLINPLQALSMNRPPPADSALVGGARVTHFDRGAYTRWLQRLRAVCDDRGIALIFDEVFMGFRLAKGGAQEFFGVRADLVTYGKTLGGGLPVGVVCGRRDWMRRYRDDAPADLCFARGTFLASPYVMGAMNEMLLHLETAEARATWHDLESRWDARAARWNQALSAADVPVRVANFTSVFTTNFLTPGRYHWLLQYYARAEGLALPWTGTGRFIFSHDLSDDEFDEIVRRFVRAARLMASDGFFWRPGSAAEKLNAALGRARELASSLMSRGPLAPVAPTRKPPKSEPSAPRGGREREAPGLASSPS